MNSLTILGSTGSIGLSALRVVRSAPDKFKVFGLACNRNVEILSKQIDEFRPAVVAIGDIKLSDSETVTALRVNYPDVEFLFGEEGITDLASRGCDMVLSSIVGGAGLRPSLAALDGCKRLALANKETLVMAGDIFMKMAGEKGVELIPVDSEHSAIFMLMQKLQKRDVERIILTASGGSLRDYPAGDLKNVTPEMALKHPTWSMGSKITIDSATLMNKGLEVIEAHYLFETDYDRISVVIHPESIIHSMVETVDGAVYAHMGQADMALPILNAFSYPEKFRNSFGRLNFAEVGMLTFREYDSMRYPALELCYHAGRKGGNAPALLNAANEEAVYAFLDRRIAFTDIVNVVEKTMGLGRFRSAPDINGIFESDAEARDIARGIIREIKT